MLRLTRSSIALSLVLSTLVGAGLTACNDNNTPTSTANTAARAVAIAGYQQAVTVGTTGADSLAVVVYDSNGSLMPGATVTWTLSDGQGTLSSASSVTDANGVARVAFTAGTTSGVAHVAAAVGNVEPVSFEEDLTPGAPARLVAMQAVTDTLAEGATLTGPLLRVVDQFGNAVPNVTVTATVQQAGDGDALANATLVSDSTGVISDTFVAGDVAGDRLIVFTTDGGLTLSFDVDVVTTSAT